MLASHLENEMRDTNNINSLFYVCSKGINSCLFASMCVVVYTHAKSHIIKHKMFAHNLYQYQYYLVYSGYSCKFVVRLPSNIETKFYVMSFYPFYLMLFVHNFFRFFFGFGIDTLRYWFPSIRYGISCTIELLLL